MNEQENLDTPVETPVDTSPVEVPQPPTDVEPEPYVPQWDVPNLTQPATPVAEDDDWEAKLKKEAAQSGFGMSLQAIGAIRVNETKLRRELTKAGYSDDVIDLATEALWGMGEQASNPNAAAFAATIAVGRAEMTGVQTRKPKPKVSAPSTNPVGDPNPKFKESSSDEEAARNAFAQAFKECGIDPEKVWE